MKAPDKIYMPNDLLTEDWQRHIPGQDVAYIRKDALLEWAEQQEKQALEDLMNGLPLNGKLSAFRRVVVKIESM